ncbi:AbrB/MazE/SpoVT family DNA-binding domain-containing protein [Nanoarchaeota archaeon]
MKRKLVLMGKHTLMSAIPSKWIDRHNLKKGDYVEFIEVENKLVLTSTAEIFERKTEVTIKTDKITETWRVILPAYLSGYNEVKINYENPNALKLIESHIKELIGFEIVETNPKYVRVMSISKTLDDDFQVIFKRVWFVLKQSSEITKGVFSTRRKKRLDEIRALEFTINRYVNFLRRVINRTGYKYPHYMYLIISFIELTANHLDYIRRYYLIFNKNKRIDNMATKDYDKIHDLIEKVYDMYYNYSDDKFLWVAHEQPHFHWFKKIKDQKILADFRAMVEYLVQIARQIKALNT